MKLISAQKFYTQAQHHSKKILIIIGFFWAFLLYILFNLPIEKNSTAFFPDNTKTLKSMTKAMEMASFSQNIYVDFQTTTMPLDELVKHIQNVQQNLNPDLVIQAQDLALPKPLSVLELLPIWFDEGMQQDFQRLFRPEHIEQSIQNAQSLMLGFPTAGTLDWIRNDPLGLRQLVQNRLPSIDSISTTPKINPEYGFALSKDREHLLLVLQPQKSIHNTEFALELMQNIDQALEKLPPQINTKIIGAIRHTAANTQAIDADILWISLVSILGLALIYATFIRSIGGLWLLLTPCLAISIALGMVHLFFGIVSGLAVGFGMSILGIAEDYAVHMHFALRSNENKNTVFKALNTPLLQGFLLNASGFALLLFSAIPAVRQLSTLAIVALFSGFILALYILPLCPKFDKPHIISKNQNSIPRKIPRLIPTLALCLSFGLISIVLFKFLPIDVSPQSMGANAHNIQDESKDFIKTWQLTSPSLLLIDAQNEAKALQETRAVQNILRENLPQIRFTSLADILPSDNVMRENLARWHNFIQKNSAQLKANFDKFSTELPAQTVFEPFFSFLQKKPKPIDLAALKQGPWGTLVQNLFQYYPQEAAYQSRIIANAKLTQEQIPPAIYNQVTLFTPEGLEQNLRTTFFKEARYLPLMFLFCIILLFLCFRNTAQTLLAALPALAAIFCVFLTMLLWQKPLTLASLAAMPLVLGLSIDHGILATHHLARGLALQMNRAIIVSSLTACVSMGMLAFATHPTLQAMGHVVFVGLLVEMPVSIWLLPRLCKEQCHEI